MNYKHIILILLLPLSEVKAIFYNINKEVSWYLFSNHTRQLCMVVEDYCNILIFGIVFYFLLEALKNKIAKQIVRFLFVLNALDLIHLGLMDMQGFVIVKLILAFGIYKIWSKLKPLY